MRKVDRLFEILQLLRGQRLRTAEFIANELGVSVRTVYRDIQGLMASGIPIEGERGVGYLIQQPIEVPPLQFTPLELKALQLGIQMVIAAADDEMGYAANEASLKIIDALQKPVATSNDPVTYVYFESDAQTRDNLYQLRTALSDKKKISLSYVDDQKLLTSRIIRPLGLEYWGKVWTVTAWCELRDNFRVFRVDRIDQCTLTTQTYRNEKGKTYQDFLKQLSHKDD